MTEPQTPEPGTPPAGSVTESRPCHSPDCGGRDTVHWQPMELPEVDADEFPLSSPGHASMAWFCSSCGAQSQAG